MLPNWWWSISSSATFFHCNSKVLALAKGVIPAKGFGSTRPCSTGVSLSSRIHIPWTPFHVWFQYFLCNDCSKPPRYGERFSSRYPSISSIMLCSMQHVVNAASMSRCLCTRELNCFKSLNLTFKIPKTPSMSFRTLSRVADQRMVGLPGTLFLHGEMRHGQRW